MPPSGVVRGRVLPRAAARPGPGHRATVPGFAVSQSGPPSGPEGNTGLEQGKVVPACATSQHRASSSGNFGVTVWGTDSAASYGYPAGGNLQTIDQVDVAPAGQEARSRAS